MVENVRGHEQAGRIVGGVDVNGAGVGANEGFKGGEIVGPGVCGAAAPFGDGGAGAFGNGESAFVARSFDDGVILRSKQCVIENKDGFFGGGKNNELIGMDLGVHGGENFSKPGSAGGFGVAAPLAEEGVVSAGFEGEDFLDGLGLGVGGGKKVLGGEFVLAHVLFNAEGRDLHEGECAKRKAGESRTKLSGGRTGHPAVGHLSEYATYRELNPTKIDGSILSVSSQVVSFGRNLHAPRRDRACLLSRSATFR